MCVCVMVCCLRVRTGLYLLCYLQTLKVSILLRQLLSACYNSPTDVSSFSHNNSDCASGEMRGQKRGGGGERESIVT